LGAENALKSCISLVEAWTPIFWRCGAMFAIEMVKAGNRGLSPGVVAME
jgi:hypothetical protein